MGNYIIFASSFFLPKTSIHGISHAVEKGTEKDSGNGIHHIMGFHINSGKKENQSEREEYPEKLATARFPCENEGDDSHADMAAWKRGCGVLTRLLSRKHHLAERSSDLKRENFRMVAEIVVHMREVVGHAHLHPVGTVIILWSRHWLELKHEIEHKERG